MSTTPIPNGPRIFEVIGPTVEKVCQYVRPAPPVPRFTVKAMFERSLHLLKIEERQAQVDRLETIANNQKLAVVEAIGLLVRTAESVRYGLEMGRIEQMVDDELFTPMSLVIKARDQHNNSLADIAYEKAQIEDMQRTLDDPALWEQEAR